MQLDLANLPADVNLLHRLVREGLPELHRALDEANRQLPRYVERELEQFTTCGDPSLGFAWLQCEGCNTTGWCRSPAEDEGSAPPVVGGE